MRYAHTAVHVYHRPHALPALRGVDGALQLALGVVQFVVFVVAVYFIGALVGRLL